MKSKLILTFILCIFLIGFVSGAVSVTLNTPANNSIQYSNSISFNTNSSTSIGTITNTTLYTKVNSGTWTLNETISIKTDSNGVLSSPVTQARTTTNGMKITMNTNAYLNEVRLYNGATPTNARLWDSSKSQIGDNVSVSGNLANFTSQNIRLEAGKSYYIVFDSGGSSYNRVYDTSVIPPTNAINLNYVGGYSDDDDAPTVTLMISNITTDPDETWLKVYSSGDVVLWNVRACASDGTCEFATNNFTFIIDSSAPTINISSPTGIINYGKIGSNLTLNFTTTDTNLDSCWYNYNGINTSVSCSDTGLVDVVEDSNIAFTYGTNTGTLKNGAIILIGDENMYIKNIGIGSPNTATKCYVQNLAGDTNLAIGNIVGSSCSVNTLLSKNTEYRIVVDAEGESYNYNGNSSVTYNYSNGGAQDGTYIKWTAGINDGAGHSNRIWAIRNVTMGVAPSAVNFTITNKGIFAINSVCNEQGCDYTNISYAVPSSCIGLGLGDLRVTTQACSGHGALKLLQCNGSSGWVTIATTGVCGISIFNTYNFINYTNYQAIKVYANDTAGNIGSGITSWDYNVFDNGVTYSSPVIEGELTQINASFDISTSPSSIILTYNGTNSTPSVSIVGNTYYLSSTITSPGVAADSNISFYYTFVIGSESVISDQRNQTVLDVGISTSCGGGTFPFLNIANYDEDLLTTLNGTVEYTLILTNNNQQITSTNGTNTGTTISLCSSKNLSSSASTFSLELRYYKNDSTYFYETYNVQNSPGATTPLNVNLYYLNISKGTQFKINYQDFYYITHPGAIIQIQRQYLAENIYRIVEIPKIADNGQALGSFNTNNIRYKIIVIENGIILDTFNDVFPVCQSVILGQCELNLRGAKSQQSSTTGDFTYTITKTNNTIILTYIIPSGTPKLITLLTNQDSRFLNNITTCNISIFASGGTITCPYNETIGDSLISLTILTNGANPLYGTIQISEDLSGFFLGNNYFISFILLLSLGLMFISSRVFILIVGAVGILYLGLIFLIKGTSLTTIATSIVWLFIVIIIAIYKISRKEEKT